jgi:hypothetical protein
MATRKSHRTDTASREETASARHPEDVSGPNGSGANGAAPAEGAPRPVMERAEQMADRIGERIGYFASLIGRKIVQLASRTREEAEDIWAEANEIRRRRRGEQESGEDKA